MQHYEHKSDLFNKGLLHQQCFIDLDTMYDEGTTLLHSAAAGILMLPAMILSKAPLSCHEVELYEWLQTAPN